MKTKFSRWATSAARIEAASSAAYRLKPLAIEVRLKPDPVHWFLADKDDVRSSYYLEDVSTEFEIQGLELDWVCDASRAIYREHETGYGAEVTEKLILFALQTYRLNGTIRPVTTAYYHGIELHQSPLDCVVIEDCILLTFTALFDNNEFNINRGKSYLKALDLHWGLAANFGKTKAEFAGITNRTQHPKSEA